jgi:hypothetical protein
LNLIRVMPAKGQDTMLFSLFAPFSRAPSGAAKSLVSNNVARLIF